MSGESLPSKFEQIKNIILQKIADGELGPGERLPTRRDMMATYKVSCATISRALVDLEHEGIIYKRQGSGTFVCEPKASPVAKQVASKGPIQIILFTERAYRLDNPFHYYSDLLGNIEETLQRAGHQVSFSRVVREPGDSWNGIDAVIKGGLLGALLVGVAGEPILNRLERASVPLVVVDHLPKDASRFDTVSMDNREGGLAATRHLLVLGHERIGYLGGAHAAEGKPLREVPNSQRRRLGYLRALEERGLKSSARLIRKCRPNPDVACETMRDWIDEGKLPTALFVFADNMAAGVIRACQEKGVRVPEDLSIVGFGDDEVSAYLQPPLTTLRVDRRQMGQEAADLLMKRIRKPNSPKVNLTVPVALVERQSCAPREATSPTGSRPARRKQPS